MNRQRNSPALISPEVRGSAPPQRAVKRRPARCKRASAPRRRLFGRALSVDLVPPLPEGSSAHVLGPGCDEVLRSLVGKNALKGFVSLPASPEDAPDGEAYQLPRRVRIS